jgi:hypothetical protein
LSETEEADPVVTYLAAARERYAGVARFSHLYVKWAADLERTGGGSEYDWMARSLLDVPRLLAAVEAALTLADGWIRNSAAVPLIDREAAGLGIRAVIAAALTGEAIGDGN